MMTPIFRTYRLPLAITLLVVAVLASWAWHDWQDFSDRSAERERHHSSDLSKMLANTIRAMEEDGHLEHNEIQKILDSFIRSSPYRFLVLKQNGKIIYQVGDLPATLVLPSAETAQVAEGFYIFSYIVSMDKSDIRNADVHSFENRKSHHLSKPHPGEYLLVLGGPVEHLEREYLFKHTFVRIAVAIFFLIASVAAWHMVIRNRILAEQLKMERARSAHLEELGLAAAGLAHETKNPLGIISGIAQQIACDPEIPEQSRTLVNAIIDEVDKSASRLGHFMTFAGRRTINPVQLDIQRLCNSIAEILQAEFDAAKVVIEVDCPSMMVLADEDMLRQILVNLLLNSLQASAEGGRVRIGLMRRGTRVTLEVADRGCGIPPELLPNIFKPYVAGKPDGHGLGLAIVKRLVEEHGWTVKADSQLGHGTIITISGIMPA